MASTAAPLLDGPAVPPAVVRVLPDVSGLDKEFDYRLPAAVVATRPSLAAFVGAIVRVPLHGRRVVGWIVAVDPPEVVSAERLHDVIAVVSHGPAPELLELAAWASTRWAAGRLRPFLVAASPARRVPTLPSARRTAPVEIDAADPVVEAYGRLVRGAVLPARRPTEPTGESLAHTTLGDPRPWLPSANRAAEARIADSLPGDSGGLAGPDQHDRGASGTIAVSPTTSPVQLIAALANDGPVLVAVPAVARAAAIAAALRRRGLTVALVPEDWARAAAGVDVVIGARAAAWAPCPGVRSIVVVDEDDDALQEERAPTWHARDVLAERARRAGARFVQTTPAPSVAGGVGMPAVAIRWESMVAGWPMVEIVDRTDDEPWASSLVTSRLIHFLRQPELTVVCVHNVPGRARVLACRGCRALARCTRCDAAVALTDDQQFSCRRCGERRPPVCAECGRGAFANLKPGVTRLAEELSAAAGRPVATVTAVTTGFPGVAGGPGAGSGAATGSSTGFATDVAAGVYVGTEAVLHRVPRADVVAFLDIDRELLAPRYRAREQTLTLLVRGARLLGPRRRRGRLLIQTYLPDDTLLQSVFRNDPLRATADEFRRREPLRLPPTVALAAVSGEGSDELIAALRAQQPPVAGLSIGGNPDRHLVSADDWTELGAALIAAKQQSGSRPRIEVDPPRA